MLPEFIIKYFIQNVQNNYFILSKLNKLPYLDLLN